MARCTARTLPFGFDMLPKTGRKVPPRNEASLLLENQLRRYSIPVRIRKLTVRCGVVSESCTMHLQVSLSVPVPRSPGEHRETPYMVAGADYSLALCSAINLYAQLRCDPCMAVELLLQECHVTSMNCQGHAQEGRRHAAVRYWKTVRLLRNTQSQTCRDLLMPLAAVLAGRTRSPSAVFVSSRQPCRPP